MINESTRNTASVEIDKDLTRKHQSIVENVAERLSFFFSDANLRVDKYLRQKIFQQNSGGFVSIDNLLRFNTIKNFTSDKSVVAKAAKHKKCSKILKLSDDGMKIARRAPFTKSIMKDNIKVTLRVSNIPVEGTDENMSYKVTRDDIRTLFENYGHVALVRMLHRYNSVSKDKSSSNDDSQKKNSRRPIGKAFVEFEKQRDFQNAADDLCIDHQCDNEEINDPRPKKVLKIGGNILIVKTMQKWLDKKLEKKSQKVFSYGCGSNEDLQEEKKIESDTNKDRNDTNELENTSLLKWEPGCIIFIEGLPNDCSRQKISEAISSCIGPNVKVSVDYSCGLNYGHIRFREQSENITKLVKEMSDGNTKICGSVVRKAYVIDAEEEEKYYKEFIGFKNKQTRLRADERQRKKFKVNN